MYSPAQGVLALLIPLLIYVPCLAADDKSGIWVEAEGDYHLGDDTTMELAQRASLEAARRAAIENALGVHVSGSTLVRNAQLVEDLVHVVSKGIIVEERILERGLKAEGTKGVHATYVTKIKAKVVRVLGSKHSPNFSIRCRLNRASYQHGELAEFRVSTNQDAYIYAFNITEDEHITVLVPNRFLPEIKVRDGAEFVFPTAELVTRSIVLRTMVMPGKHHSAESIKVIATRRPVDMLKRRAPEAIFEEYRPGDTTLVVDLLKVLASLDADEWAECSTAYDIVRVNP